MTECIKHYGRTQEFRYKPNANYNYYLGRFTLKERDNKFEIWGLSIMGEHRCKGYATRMLTEFLSQFKSDKPLSLYVYKANEIAIHLYEKVGFTIVSNCFFDASAYEMQYTKTERK